MDAGLDPGAPPADWIKKHLEELAKLDAPPSSVPVWARGVSQETLAGMRPAGGFDPTAYEDLMTTLDAQSRTKRPPTNEQSVNQHALPIRDTPVTNPYAHGPSFNTGPAWTQEDRAKGRRTPLPPSAAENVIAAEKTHFTEGPQAIRDIAAGKDVGGNIVKAAGHALGAVFDPILEPIQDAIVRSDPTLSKRLKDIGGGPGAASQVLDELRAGLKAHAEDQNAPAGERFDAGAVATLLSGEKLAEYGAPQAITGLARLASRGILNQLKYEARTGVARPRISPTDRGFNVSEAPLSEAGKPAGGLGPPGAYDVNATGSGELAPGAARPPTPGAGPLGPTAIPPWARSLEENAAATGTAGSRPGQVQQNDILRQAIAERMFKPISGGAGGEPPKPAIPLEAPGTAPAATDAFRHQRWVADTARDAALSDAELTTNWLGNYNAENGYFDGPAVRIAQAALQSHPGAKAVPLTERRQFAQDAATLALSTVLPRWDRGKGPLGAILVPRIRGQVADALRQLDTLTRSDVRKNRAANEAGGGAIISRPQFQSLDIPVQSGAGSVDFMTREIGAQEIRLAQAPEHPAYQKIVELAKSLTGTEKKVFERMYLGGGTLMQVGEDLGLSESGVSRSAMKVRAKILAMVESSEEPVLQEFLAMGERRQAAMADAQARADTRVDSPGYVREEAFRVKRNVVAGRGGPLPELAPSVGKTQPAPGGGAAPVSRAGTGGRRGRPRADVPYGWKFAQNFLDQYTPEQQKILRAYYEGGTAREVASRFGISESRLNTLTRSFTAAIKKAPPIGGGSGEPDVVDVGKLFEQYIADNPPEIITDPTLQISVWTTRDFADFSAPDQHLDAISAWMTPDGRIFAGFGHHEDLIDMIVPESLDMPMGAVAWGFGEGLVRMYSTGHEVGVQIAGRPTEAQAVAVRAVGARAAGKAGKSVNLDLLKGGAEMDIQHELHGIDAFRNAMEGIDTVKPISGGAGNDVPQETGAQAMERHVTELAQKYGFGTWQDAAQAIEGARAGDATSMALVAKMPRPLQDQITGHALFSGQPLRDEATILAELEAKNAGSKAAELEWRRLRKKKTRTVYNKKTGAKVTYEGASQAAVNFQESLSEQLASEAEALTAELTYGRETRALGPTDTGLAQSTERAAAAIAPTRGPLIQPADVVPPQLIHPEAPVETRARHTFGAGVQAGKRQAVDALRAKVQQAVDELARQLTIDDASAPTSARKIAAALKQIAADNEALIPRLNIGKKGATTKKTSEYRKSYARDVQPYVDLRKNITDAIEELRNIEKGGLLDWEKLSLVQQVEWLQRKYPKLTDLEQFRTEIANATDYQQRQDLVAELNDYTKRFYQWEQAGGAEPGTAPIDIPSAPYPEVGHGLPGTGALKLQREQLIADLRAHLQQAADLGVDQNLVNPVWKATSQALEQITGLKDELDRVAAEAGVPVDPGPEAEMVGSLNLDYIADPLARQAIREHYLRRAPQIEEATRRMGVEELRQNANDLAAMVGGDPAAILEFVATKLPRRGDVVKYIYLTRLTLAEQALELRRLATRNITDERWDKAMEIFDAIIETLNPAVSEAGRTLRYQQEIVGREGAKAAELEQPVQTADLLLNEKNKEWRKAVAEAEQAAQKALAARVKAQAMKNAIEDGRARAAEGAAQKAQDRADQLKIAYDRIEMAKIAAEERRRNARMLFLTEGLIHARKKGATPEMLRSLASLDPDKDFQQIVNLLRNIEPASGGEKLTGYVLNNMYSGARANEANILGNAFQLGRFLMLDPLAARTTAPLIAKFSGRPQAIVPQEFRFALMAVQHGTPRALRNFLNIMRAGRGASDISEEIPAGSKFELGAPDLFPGPWGFLAEGALRTLSGIDAAFFHLSYVIEYDTMLARLAVSQGAKSYAEITDKMVDYIIDPPAKLNEFAGTTAAEMTYRQQLDRFTDAAVKLVSTPVPLPERIPLPGRMKQFEQANIILATPNADPREVAAAQALLQRSSVAFLGDTPMFKWFLTPIMFTANAAKTAVQFAGGGAISAPYHVWRTGQMLRAGKISAEQAAYFDRVASRTGLIGVAGALLLGDAIIAYVNDDLTGEGPTDPQARKVWAQTHQPFSRKIAGVWHRYDQVWPAGSAYTFVARIGDAIVDGRLKEQDAIEITARGFAAFGTALLDQPFIRNIAGFHDFMDNLRQGGATRAVESYAATVARKFEWYSAFFNDISRTLDPYERDPQTFLEMLEAKLPLISKDVRTALNRWGEDVMQRPTGPAYLMPGAGVEPVKDPVNDEVTRLETVMKNGAPILAPVSFVDKTIGGIDLSPDEAHFYQQQAGQQAHREIAALMGTVSWGGWNDERKAKEVRAIVNHTREEARRAVANKLMGVKEMPDGQQVQFTDTGPVDRARGLRIGLSAANSVYERVKLVEKWIPAFDADPALSTAFETYRGDDPFGAKDYRELAPKVTWLEQQAEFATADGKAVGDAGQWQQYHAEYKEWKKIETDSGPVAARLYFLSKPVLQVFTKLSQRPGGKNPLVAVARLQDPRLKRVVLPRDTEIP